MSPPRTLVRWGHCVRERGDFRVLGINDLLGIWKAFQYHQNGPIWTGVWVPLTGGQGLECFGPPVSPPRWGHCVRERGDFRVLGNLFRGRILGHHEWSSLCVRERGDFRVLGNRFQGREKRYGILGAPYALLATHLTIAHRQWILSLIERRWLHYWLTYNSKTELVNQNRQKNWHK